MGNRSLGGLLAAMALAGCAEKVPVEREVVVTGTRYESVRGEADLTVRTFIETDNGMRSEVSGATCAVSSSLYDAELVTPARLAVPNFGEQSPELRLDCYAAGRRGSASVPVRTYWRDGPGGWGYPSIGVYGGTGGYSGVGIGWNYGGWGYGGWGPSYPVSDYPNTNVVLR